MKKSIIKSILSVSITLSLTIGTSLTAFGATADQLYSNAYAATSSAISQKTQTAINNARTAIDALKGTGAAFAIGEFSKQVDQVQQPILVTICNAINVIQEEDKTGNFDEKDITIAHNAIPSNLPDVWRSSYSSAVDLVQQHYQQKALDAWALFKKVSTQKNHDAAWKLLSDIATNSWNNEAFMAWFNNVVMGN